MKRIRFALGIATLLLTTCAFQCASTQMNTAKVKMQGGDYAAAKTSLQEEVTLRPENGEAWYLLGTVESELGNFKEMRDAFDQAIRYKDSPTGKVTPDQLQNIHIATTEGWSNVYQKAVSHYSARDYPATLGALDTAEMIDPGNPLTLKLRGMTHLAANQEGAASTANLEYIRLTRSDFDKGLADGLRLGMTRDEVHKLLKAPAVAYDPERFQSADVYPAKNLHVYYDEVSGTTMLQGWKYYEPNSTPYYFYGLSSDPYYNEAYYLFDNGKYDDALELLFFTEKIDPTRSEVANLIGQTYIKAGRLDEARVMLKQRIASEPDNLRYRQIYAQLLHDAKDYAGAIATLNEALDLPAAKATEARQDLLYFIAAFYKNWGVNLENATGGSSPTPSEEYNEKYKEAIRYFTQHAELSTQKDYTILWELGQLYATVGDEAGLKKAIGDFESIQEEDRVKNDPVFWQNLSKLYYWNRDDANYQKALDRAKSLGG